LLSAAGLGCALLALLALELLLRSVNPHYLDDRPQAGLALLHRYSELYGWEPRPGAVAFIDGHRTTINARGMRGPEHAVGRSSRTRLLMLGDSIAFGHGVADGETFSDRLEEHGFEVVNLAVDGYGTDQSVLRLEHEGKACRPDVVLLHFCADNDFVDNVSRTYFYDGLHPKPYFTIDGEALVLHDEALRLSTVSRLGLWLHGHSHLFNHLEGRAPVIGAGWTLRRQEALRDGEGALQLTVRLIARAEKDAEDCGAAFLVLVYPGRREFHEGSPWLAALHSAPRLHAIRQVDMGERLRSRGLTFHSVALDSIGHLSAFGHRQAAAVIEEELAAARSRP